MRAIVCPVLGGPEVLELRELQLPEPGPGEVRIRVRAAGVNFADTLQLQGRYQEKAALPFVPGLEVAGEIDGLGPAVDGLVPGARVLALLDRGGFAEQAIGRACDVVEIPDELDFATAAGLAVTYGTAYGALIWRAALQAGDWLLVHGAAGGVGLAAVECGKALGGRVIATARGADRAAVATAHGADPALDSDGPALVSSIKEITGGHGVDVAFDPVGGAMFDAALRTVAWGGRIVLIGFASGAVPQIPANRLLVKNAAALGFYWGSYRRHDPARVQAALVTLLDWYRAGLIRPHVGTRLPLARAADALTLLQDRKATGKIVLEP